MSFKDLMKLSAPISVISLVTLITIRLSGHRQSLGILAIGLALFDFISIFICSILRTTKVITTKRYYICLGLITLTFIVFIVYHRSYSSYYETRRLFWGLNGEIDEINTR